MSKKSIKTLLLIEDNPGDARLFLETFKEQGSHDTELTYAKSMSEAEKHLAAHSVDIIILDLGLPDTQGLEAVRRAHAAAPHVPLSLAAEPISSFRFSTLSLSDRSAPLPTPPARGVVFCASPHRSGAP